MTSSGSLIYIIKRISIISLICIIKSVNLEDSICVAKKEDFNSTT